MAKKTVEETHVDNINKGIKLIVSGKKTPKEANIGASLNRLKLLNPALYFDLMNDYKAAINGVPENSQA